MCSTKKCLNKWDRFKDELMLLLTVRKSLVENSQDLVNNNQVSDIYERDYINSTLLHFRVTTTLFAYHSKVLPNSNWKVCKLCPCFNRSVG